MGLLQFELHTPMKPGQVMETLRSLSRPSSWWETVQDGLPFRGTVGMAGFSLREVTQWRHVYYPRLLGKVSTHAGRTVVTVGLRPSVGIWVAYVVLIIISYFRTDLWGMVLAAFALFPVLWVFTLALSLTGKRLLADALQATASS